MRTASEYQVLADFTAPQPSLCYDAHDVLICYYMTQPDSLWYMHCTSAPDQCIPEMLLQSPMDAVTDVLDSAPVSYNERFVEIRIDAFSLCIDPDKAEHRPASIDNVLNPKVKFAGHNCGVRFASERVEMLE